MVIVMSLTPLARPTALPVLLVVLATLLAVAAYAPPARAEALVLTEEWVDDRTLDLTLDSPATGARPQVRLLLPDGYTPDAAGGWPVLYLLHGCCDPYTGWTDESGVAELSRDAGVIVALPAGGPAGFFSDWLNHGNGGMDWGRFVVEELPTVLAASYGANDQRAIGGLSTGGYAALAHAARHPGHYQAVAAFSPIAHTQSLGIPLLIEAMLLREGADPFGLWGSFRRNENVWRSNNPYHHVEGLRGTALYLSAGDGRPGPLDPTPAEGLALEAAVAPTVRQMALRLNMHGIPATTSFYGAGTHSWPYWDRELQRAWPMLMAALGAEV